MTRFIARFTTGLAIALSAAAAAHAGDVSASLKGQTLVVKGDDLGADLVLTPPIPLSRGGGPTVLVTPQGGTTLNGGAAAVPFDGVESVKMTLGDGTNVVLFQELSFTGKLTFKSGNGSDTLTIQDTGFADDVKITTKNGEGTLVIFAGSALGDDLTVKGGSDSDTLNLSGPVAGTLKLSLGAGANTLTSSGAVGNDSSYKGGADADTMTFSGLIGGESKLKLSNGANTVTFLDDAAVGESLKVKGGADADTITVGNLPIGADANLNFAAGDNTTTLNDTTIGDDLTVKGGSGDDTVTFGGTVAIGGETKFDLDGGTNTIPAI